jgi:hypothetical protein
MTTERLMMRLKLAPMGLDPRVHLAKGMDCRVEPGNDHAITLGLKYLSGKLEA